MKQLKLAVLLSGVAGLAGLGMPFGAGRALWLQGGALASWCTVGFAIVLTMGLMAVFGRGLRRWQAVTAVEGFAIVVFAFGSGFVKLATQGGLGGTLIALATLVGMTASIAAAIKPEAEQLPSLAPIS